MKKKSVRSEKAGSPKTAASRPVDAVASSTGLVTEPPAPPSALARNPASFLAASILLLIPCIWQSRLQAGDLSSHIYNAWLAQLIARGQAPGLSIASQTTNVLFDWILSALFQSTNAAAAQKISAALSVLVFVWGAFAFVSVVSRRLAWRAMPWIAVLAYGWVFHMGFFNFYLSLGFCFWALALAWSWESKRLSIALLLLAVAYLAHALPVVWTIGVLAYVWLSRRAGPDYQTKLLGVVLLAIVALRVVLSSIMVTRWSGQQVTLITGVDQLWVFDDKYSPLAAGALLIWGIWFWRHKGLWRSPQFHICLITAAGILLIPSAVSIPGYKHSLVYIAERMSLVLGVCVLAVLAGAPSRSYDRYVTAAVVVLFFGMLYRDERLLNQFEDGVNATATQLPRNARVIMSVEQPDLRVNALTHMIDRSCTGRCYSYANYEPSTAQFRVRVNGENPIVAATYADSFALQSGRYVVKDRDVPLYQLLADENGRIQVRTVPAGQPCGMTAAKVL